MKVKTGTVITTKQMANDLVDNLKWRPEDYSCTNGVLKDHLTLALYGMGTGFWNVGLLQPAPVRFTPSEGWRVRRAYKAWGKRLKSEPTCHGATGYHY